MRSAGHVDRILGNQYDYTEVRSALTSLHQELEDVLAIVANDSEWADKVVEEVERFWQLDHVSVAIVDGEAEFEDSFDRT